MENIREALERKLKDEQRGVKWFWENYVLPVSGIGYNTTYHQVKGIISAMPDTLRVAIEEYLEEG